MARLPRFFVPSVPLHVIQRGNNREKLFRHITDYQVYLDWLHEAAHIHECAIHAYVLMTNHVHLLVTPTHEDSVPRTFQSLGRRYVQYFNTIHQRTGTLWEGRYRATLIESETYLLTCSRYIELNPVRAEMVRHPRDYRWSSYRYNADGKSNPLMNMPKAPEIMMAAMERRLRVKGEQVVDSAASEREHRPWTRSRRSGRRT